MTLTGTKLMNNFNGKRIGVVKGTTTAVALRELFAETKTEAEILLFHSTAEALVGLEKGTIDALAADQVVLIGLALKADKPGRFSILPTLVSYEPFALAVRRNDADFRLVADRVIAELYRSKKIRPIYDKWFGQFSAQRPSAFEALTQLHATPE
jgi:ABC-type amino acid transport substrate-binding protein